MVADQEKIKTLPRINTDNTDGNRNIGEMEGSERKEVTGGSTAVRGAAGLNFTA